MFGRILKEVNAFKGIARKNPAGYLHFAAYLLERGYRLDELEEEEWRGIAELFTGPDPVAREIWLDNLAGYIGQPRYGE